MKNKLNGNGLKREIGLFSATILVIANMIGTGIFTTSGFIMAELDDPKMLLLCWFCGGLFALCGALCYGELGAMFPRAGGEYVFLRESFGKPMGFLSGWISLIVGFSAPIAAAAIAFATYLFHSLGMGVPTGTPISVFGVEVALISPLTLAAVAIIIVFSLVHYHSLAVGSRIQNTLTLFKITLVAGFIGAGFFLGNGSMDHFSLPGTKGDFSAEAVAVSLIFISFAYSGWNASAYLGGEIKSPARNIPFSLICGTVVVMGLYLLLNAVYIFAMSPEEMHNVLDVGARAAACLFGNHTSRLFSGGVAIGILSVLSAMIMTGPRIYYAMSKDGIFFSLFGKVNTRHHTPASSIFLQAAIACIMVLTASFNTLLIYIGFTLSIFAMLTVAGMIRLRATRALVPRPYKTFLYPVTPVLFILGNLWIIVFSIKSRPINTLFGIGTIAAGVLVYWFFSGGIPVFKKTAVDKPL